MIITIKSGPGEKFLRCGLNKVMLLTNDTLTNGHQKQMTNWSSLHVIYYCVVKTKDPRQTFVTNISIWLVTLYRMTRSARYMWLTIITSLIECFVRQQSSTIPQFFHCKWVIESPSTSCFFFSFSSRAVNWTINHAKTLPTGTVS